MTKDEQGYNGWANYETWNVALWIGNDEGLYTLAKDFRTHGYKAFAETMRDSFESIETPDNVAWNDSGLDIEALDEMLTEL